MAKTYNAKQVIVTWGTYNLTEGALSEGVFVEVNPTARRAMQTGLMGGDAVIGILNNTTATITVTLSAAADINDKLTDAMNLQIDEGVPQGQSLLVKDHSGRALDSCPVAVLDGYPPKSYAADGTPTYQWVFLCPKLKMEHRGSNSI